MSNRIKPLTPFLLIGACLLITTAATADHAYDGPYTGRNLNRVAFPIGGLGAGMYCLEGTGAISHVSVKHHMEFFNEPATFAAVCVKGKDGKPHVARVLEGPIPDWKYFGKAGSGNGSAGSTYGLPRFTGCEFLARFPFATINLADETVPLAVTLTGWSPFTPGDPDSSCMPLGAIEYTFKNDSGTVQEGVFSFNTRNFMGKGPIDRIDGGFVLYAAGGKDRDTSGAFAVSVLDEKDAAVDCCWFRGGWWDALTIAWDNIEKGKVIENPPFSDNAPGASLFVPFRLEPGETKTIRLLTAWYVPNTSLNYGRRTGGGAAFTGKLSTGTGPGQQDISGFLGKGLVNTFDPGGDGPTGTLTSPEFTLEKKYIHFLVGGGSFKNTTCVQLLVEGKVVASACGKDTEQLEWTTWDTAPFAGKKAAIRLVDKETGAWGHVLADHFIASDEPLKPLLDAKAVADPNRVTILADFEGEDYAGWMPDPPPKKACCEGETCSEQPIPTNYVPWYATKFKSIGEVVQSWKDRYGELRKRSERFRDAFYDTTLPPEVVEAAAANLTILKSPTILRQHDGRTWCFEGCCDTHGCCAGSCTHVWNYAQAICHLFPALERSLRRTEYFEGQDERGRQAFRVNLPISPGGGSFDASDGQLGGIMKARREWAISSDDAWLEKFYPNINRSMAYMIEKYDPRHTGLLEEEHHNTYDINYFGPDGHCGSFYLGALAAMIEMGKAVGDDVSLYEELLAKGKKRMVDELYNGEYFIQIVQKEGLTDNFHPVNPDDQSEAYRETARQVNEQGPKYQYGNGCLSDGVLGLWMAKACGMVDPIIPEDLVRNHLKAVHKYNLKKSLLRHANPQRPTFAMGDDGGLLLCSWPKGGKPLLPFVYSDEVWTGIEYQVASHLMMLGCVDEGLEIVRVCRDRYDGARRNPFNEYECGHWYARAMSSFALLQGLTGLSYDARTKTLYVDSRIGDFRAFLSTETGYGVVEFKDGKAQVDVKEGTIPIEKVEVNQGG